MHTWWKKQAFPGQNYVAIITPPQQGYGVTWVTAKCDGKEVENNFENVKLIVSNDVITGNLTIDAETNTKTYKVNVDTETNTYKFTGNNVTPQVAWESFKAALVDNIPTRAQYRYEWQDKIQNILFGLISKGDNSTKYNWHYLFTSSRL